MECEEGDREMGRGEYGDTGHKSVGNQALQDLLLLEQFVDHLLRPLYSQRCMGKENSQENYSPICHIYLFSYYSVFYCNFLPVSLIQY